MDLYPAMKSKNRVTVALEKLQKNEIFCETLPFLNKIDCRLDMNVTPSSAVEFLWIIKHSSFRVLSYCKATQRESLEHLKIIAAIKNPSACGLAGF